MNQEIDCYSYTTLDHISMFDNKVINNAISLRLEDGMITRIEYRDIIKIYNTKTEAILNSN